MWLESSVMAKCLSDEPGSSNASTRSGEALHRHLNSTMRIHLSFKWLREGRCAIHKYSQARAAVQQTQARAAMQHAHARHMQDTRTQARAAMQHTHAHTHARHTHTSEGRCATHKYSQARAAVQHTLTSEGRYATRNAHSQARAAMQQTLQHARAQARAAVQHTNTHERGPLFNRTHTHTKRGPLCNPRILTSEGRYATHALTSEGRCNTLYRYICPIYIARNPACTEIYLFA
jgi:hypothetical protein